MEFQTSLIAAVTSAAGVCAADARAEPDLGRPVGNSTYYSNPITTALRDCEVQALLAGYWSDRVSIAIRNTLDDTRIESIILHPVSRDQAFTISATTLAARNATSATAWKEALHCDPRYVRPYEGLTSLAEREQNWAELEKHFHSWIQLTPEGFPIAYLYERGREREVG